MVDAEKEYKEALEIYRELANENPNVHLKDVVEPLNPLAILHKAPYRLTAAKNEYKEASEIYRELANKNPNTYLKDVARTLNKLAFLFIKTERQKKSLSLLEESISYSQDFLQIPVCQGYFSQAQSLMREIQENEQEDAAIIETDV